MCKVGTSLDNFCRRSCKECHVKSFEKNHKAMPLTLKVSTFSTVFICFSSANLWKCYISNLHFEAKFYFFELPISKSNGLERVVMSGVKMLLLFTIKAVAWEERANQKHCSLGYSFWNIKINIKKSFVSVESNSSYLLETMFFCLFFKKEFLPASFSAPPQKPVSVTPYPQIAHQSQK